MVALTDSVSSRRSLILLAGLATILRLATAVPLHQQAFTSDEKEYLLLATRLIDDRMFLDSNGCWSVKPPGFPGLLAGMLELFGRSIFPLLLLNAIIGSLAAIVGFFVVRELVDNLPAAWFTAAVLALHPSLVVYGSVLQSEALYVVLLLLIVLVALRLVREPGFRLASVLGVLLASLTLTRAIGLAVLGTLFLFLVAAIEAPWKRRMLIPTCALGVAVLGLLPWTVRNYAVLHAFVPVSTFSGTSLLMGNNPFSNGTTALPKEYFDWVRAEGARRGFADLDSVDEVTRDRVHREIALDWIRSHPSEWLRLMGRKLEVFWIFPVTTTAENHAMQAVVMGADVVLWIGALFGVVVLWGKKKEILLLSSIILVVTSAHVMMHTEARYRLPLLALLALFFGPGLAWLLDPLQRTSIRVRRAAVGSAAAVALLLVVGYLTAGLMFIHGEV